MLVKVPANSQDELVFTAGLSFFLGSDPEVEAIICEININLLQKTILEFTNREIKMTVATTPNASNAPAEDDGIILLDILIALAKNKKKIIAISVSLTFLVAFFIFLIPNKYSARIQLIPPQDQSNSSSLGQLGALTGLAGGAIGIKNQNDMYVGIFNSHAVSDSLIKRFDLLNFYKKEFLEDARTDLAKATTITSEKSGIIIIDVKTTDRKKSVDLANGYFDEMQSISQRLSLTRASQRRLFFERQLENAKKNLAEAEIGLKNIQEKTGLIQLSDQAVGIIRAVADIRAQIAAKEVELGAMRTFATRENPEYKKLENVIEGLRLQLSKAETGANAGNGDISVATNKVPQAGLEYIRRTRDVKYYETVFELLAKQFEMSKIDEANNSSILQVLDRAEIPEKKSGPHRLILIVVAFFVFLFLAMCWVFFIERLRDEELKNDKMRILRNHMKWKI